MEKIKGKLHTLWVEIKEKCQPNNKTFIYHKCPTLIKVKEGKIGVRKKLEKTATNLRD